jgi:TusA-related sulfurtransferase
VVNQSINLQGIACPVNYIRAKFKLETMKPGEILELTLDDGEPIDSVPKSLREDGHRILSKTQNADSSWSLRVSKDFI